MTTDEIKNKIEAFVKRYRENSGTFEGFRVIYDYVNFIKSEPYIQKLLGNAINYVEKQKKILFKKIDEIDPEKFNPNKITFDLNKSPSLPIVPVFKKEFKLAEKRMKNHEFSCIPEDIPLILFNLESIRLLLAEAKKSSESNDLPEAERLIKHAKDSSSMAVSMKIKEANRMTIINTTTNMMFSICIDKMSKYILDQIDSENFLAGNKSILPVSFDKEKSLLNIQGQQIKITLKNEKPIDHYILEAIFSKDLDEQTSFMEIAEDFRETEYDAENDWQTYRHACDNLNKKISKATNNKINDFIIKTTGKTGYCKINTNYL